MNCKMPGFCVLHYLPEITISLKCMFIELVMLSNHLILCHPLLLLISIFPSIRGFFQWVSSLHQVAKVLEFQPQPSVLPMNVQDWFHIGLTGLISLLSKGFSWVFSSTLATGFRTILPLLLPVKGKFIFPQMCLFSNKNLIKCHTCLNLIMETSNISRRLIARESGKCSFSFTRLC